jgi:hypothetical protein
MGMKHLDFKWCLIRGMKRGGGETADECCAELGGEAGLTLGGGARPVALPCFSAEGGRTGWVGQKATQADGAVGSELKRSSFPNKN